MAEAKPPDLRAQHEGYRGKVFSWFKALDEQERLTLCQIVNDDISERLYCWVSHYFLYKEGKTSVKEGKLTQSLCACHPTVGDYILPSRVIKATTVLLHSISFVSTIKGIAIQFSKALLAKTDMFLQLLCDLSNGCFLKAAPTSLTKVSLFLSLSHTHTSIHTYTDFFHSSFHLLSLLFILSLCLLYRDIHMHTRVKGFMRGYILTLVCVYCILY